MNTNKLNEIGAMLNAVDSQERAIRKSAMSRRWFVRALGVTAIAAIGGGLQSAHGTQVQPAKSCNGNTSGCTGSNLCMGGNTCSGSTVNNCDPNECTGGTNYCGGGATNTCTTGNNCDTNQCTGTNSCSPFNFCHTANNCSPDTNNNCPSGNEKN